jgi:hypothetical protein
MQVQTFLASAPIFKLTRPMQLPGAFAAIFTQQASTQDLKLRYNFRVANIDGSNEQSVAGNAYPSTAIQVSGDRAAISMNRKALNDVEAMFKENTAMQLCWLYASSANRFTLKVLGNLRT